ncbi:MAG: TonB-dependent receptor, partial [Comamonadaceae bacterium]
NANRAIQNANPDLKPETSTNYEIAALWSNRSGLSASATVFYNDFQDKIMDRRSGRTQRIGNQTFAVMDWVNVDEARIAGIELQGTWQINRAWAVKGNYTRLDSKQQSGANAGAPLNLTPDQTANLRVDWQASARTQFWASVNHYGKEHGATLTADVAPAYTMADIGVNHQWSDNLRLNAAIQNIGDKQLIPDVYGKTSQGRRLWLGLNVSF